MKTLSLSLAAFLVLSSAAHAECATPLTERVTDYYRAYAARDTARLATFITPNFYLNDPTLGMVINGAEEYRQVVEGVRAIDTYEFERLDTLADGDRVVVHHRLRVTKDGMPATTEWVAYFRFEGCQIAEIWDFADYRDLNRLQRDLRQRSQQSQSGGGR